MKRNTTSVQLITLVLAVVALLCSTPSDAYAAGGIFKRKKAKAEKTEEKAETRYKGITGADSARVVTALGVHWKGDSLFLELPIKHLGRQFLVTNKMVQVPREMNEAGVNKGIVYQEGNIRFEWDKQKSRIVMREQRVTPNVDKDAAIARSVADNYIDPIVETMKVEAVSADSTTLLFKANDLFDGSKTTLNDVFANTNLGTSAKKELSRIVKVTACEKGLVALSELSTVVHEGMQKANITVVVSTALTMLPAEPMARRTEDWRVGYFTTPSLQFADEQQAVKRTNHITRWRLVPSDTAAYLRGELTDPVQPITFHIDPAVPAQWRPFIKQGIEDWNKAFEQAGFSNAIRALDYTDSIHAEGEDLKYSVLTYDASQRANAMGPSVVDPRSGEILEADIIWWHNVLSLIREWLMVQTGPYNPQARQLQMPNELMGDAVRFVACHEVGHSLGLRHNMIASAAYPTDSLRSAEFMKRVGGTSASIMDYARFNYVAQPGDDVTVISPHIGAYDLMAIDWGYRWFGSEADEKQCLEELLKKYQGREYRYSETQSQRTAIDPRAMSEDLGDDPVKSAKYGIANLKRVMPNIVNWTHTEDASRKLDEASSLYFGVVFQWGTYLYHVLANVGGMYLDRPDIESDAPVYTFVEKEKQKESVQFFIDELFTTPKWLFDTPLTRRIYVIQNTPLGQLEVSPSMMLREKLSYILWDLLANERLVRMSENEMLNGKEAFTPMQMMDMLHKAIFAPTIAGQTPDVMQRFVQKDFVDALITAAAESEGVKINKKLTDDNHSDCCQLTSGSRQVQMTSTQISRMSDALSVKRGEMLAILQLLKSKGKSGDKAAQMHYEDIAMRIKTALGMTK